MKEGEIVTKKPRKKFTETQLYEDAETGLRVAGFTLGVILYVAVVSTGIVMLSVLSLFWLFLLVPTLFILIVGWSVAWNRLGFP